MRYKLQALLLRLRMSRKERAILKRFFSDKPVIAFGKLRLDNDDVITPGYRIDPGYFVDRQQEALNRKYHMQG